MNNNLVLWDFIYKLWENGCDKSKFVNQCIDYWEGKFSNQHRNKALEKTGTNVVKPIVETKLKAMLDAEFTFAVVPKVKSFQDIQAIKDLQAVADVYNDELHNIFQNNNITQIKELVGRYGLMCGFGLSQVSWDISKRVEGDIKINFIESSNIRWDGSAKRLDDMTWIGYKIQLSPAIIKERYCKNEKGEFDYEKCRQIDNLVNRSMAYQKEYSKDNKNVIAFQDTSNNNSGLAYVGDKVSGLKQDKIVDLVCMFLLDDSLYSPEENESQEKKEFKQIGSLKYPYGRMILFCPSKENKIVLEDVALDKNFKNLGNIDIFNPMNWKDIAGKGEVEDLMPIQDRINAMYNNYVRALSNHFSCIFVPKESGITKDAIVKFPVIAVDNIQDLAGVQVFTNNGIGEASTILDSINQLQQYAYQNSRVNETMLFGQRQTGTTSAEQVEALQESPLADIRAYQANFKQWIISVGEKCINFIQNKYTVNRLIKLSTNMDGAKFANISINNEATDLTLYDESFKAIKTINMNPDWEFQIEVIAGTEIPRTRKEQSVLMDNMLASGIFDKLKDLDLLEMYMKFQDVPNYRAIMQTLRKKQDEAKNVPPDYDWKNMFNNPDVVKEFSNLFDKLGGYSLAKQAMLETIGLPSNPGKLDNTPVTEITSQSEVAEVATMSPTIISDNLQDAVIGNDAAKADQLIQTLK